MSVFQYGCKRLSVYVISAASNCYNHKCTLPIHM